MINNRFVFVVPCYNARDTIVQMMLSVLSQTHSNWKIIFRDDMSTDGTPDIIKSFVSHMGIEEKISLKSIEPSSFLPYSTHEA